MMEPASGTAPRRTLPQRMFCLLGLAPVVLACWGTCGVGNVTPLVGERRVVSLAFSQYAVNLGEVPPVGTIPASFFFWNQSDTPIHIQDLKASCGCLAPKLVGEKEIYAPGEHGQFIVSAKTANETPGPKSYTVTVRYDDGQPREAQLHFRMVVPERKVTVTPSEVYFYQLSGKPDSREILVEDHRGSRLEVLSAEVSSDQVRVRVESGQAGSNGSWGTAIHVDVPATVRQGREIAVLTIRTNDPDYQTIKLPILIQGVPPAIQQTSGESTMSTHRFLQSRRESLDPESKSDTRESLRTP